ncbi:MFS transporter [Roseomonas populi]|uniref:MFS transporter n=1 Tax=Roseomonas populi TaxID=3121582 RepID=A0ABT1XA53_9PROT|nr:MFS transporter [Roseomonas pecuniae]MCR0984996.1 MFS transporter [Roseomonas pecuniae]
MKAFAQVFFGWRVVGAAFVLAMFAWGVHFYGLPIFLQVLHASRGWPVSVVSGAITAHFLLGAAVVGNLAALHRRFGLVAVTRAGLLLTALGLLGWAFAAVPWQLYLAAPVTGAGWALSSGAALNAMVSPWFARRRPAALGMAFNGASVGGVVFSPLWVVLIAEVGFHTAAVMVASVIVVVGWLLSGRYLGPTPATMGLLPDGDAPSLLQSTPGDRSRAVEAEPFLKAWHDRRFVTLTASTTLGFFAQIGLVAHLFSLLAPTLGAGVAGLTMSGVTACAISGRFLLGAAMPQEADRRVVAAANAAMQALGSVILLCAGPSVPLLLLGCALFGLGLGNSTSLPALIAQAEFRPADVAWVVGLVTAISQAGYAFAPAAFGFLRDIGATGSSMNEGVLLFATAAIVQSASAGMLLLARRSVPGSE